MLRVLAEIPTGLEELSARELADALGRPTLIRLAPRPGPPVFVSVLLHGNETTGWEAARRVLRRHRRTPLADPLDLFIGNVEAARLGRRRLDRQPDFNRIWADRDGPEAVMAGKVLAHVRRRPPRLVLDVHNTSGSNPPYACCHRLHTEHLTLARSFSDTVVFVDRPQGMLGVTLAALAPTATLECGRPGDAAMEHRVADFIEQVLEDDLTPLTGGHDHPLLQCAAVVRVPAHCRFGFHDGDADLQLMPRLDRYNFTTVAAGTPIARVRPGSAARLQALDAGGNDVWERFFSIDDGWLRARVDITPSLLTLDERIIRQDCLCYLMEPLPAPDAAGTASP
jgi:hypothetical protein